MYCGRPHRGKWSLTAVVGRGTLSSEVPGSEGLLEVCKARWELWAMTRLLELEDKAQFGPQLIPRPWAWNVQAS